MKKLKVAVIGTGFGQQVHVPVFNHLPDCEVVAIASSNLEKATVVAQRLGVARAYGSWQEMLDREEIHILSIATLPGLQYEIAKRAMEKSIALFCEKPLALNPDQSLELMTMAGKKLIPQMVDFEFGEIPIWRECHRLLQSAAIGTLERLEVVWTTQTYANRNRTLSWKTNNDQGGGPLFSFASHSLYYLEWLAGPIAALRCRCDRSPQDARGVDTSVFLEARLGSGAVASLRIDTDDALKTEHRLRFQGNGGNLILQNTGKDYIQGFQLLIRRNSDKEFTEVQPSAGWDANPGFAEDGRLLAVGSLARRLVQWVQGEPASQPDFTAGHQVQQLLALALDSHSKGGTWEVVNSTPIKF